MEGISRTGKALGRSEVEKIYQSKLVSLDTAAGMIKSHSRVFVSGNAATPTPLLEALAQRKDELEQVELVHVLQLGPDPFLAPEMEGHFRRRSLFVGPADREAVNSGRPIMCPSRCIKCPGCSSGVCYPWTTPWYRSPPRTNSVL